VDDIAVFDGGELCSQGADGGNVEFVLVRLKIAELGELFAAIVETAQVWLRLIVHDLVSTNISTLSEPFSTDLALVWAFSSVSSFVSLQVSKL
jgi:hypothetical protein